MKKTLTNSDIITIYDALNGLNGRSDMVPGDVEVFWANKKNTKVLKEKAEEINSIVQEIVNSHFTDENSHPVVDEDGNETGGKVLNDDVKDQVLEEINADINKIYVKPVEIDLELIPQDSLTKMFKANEGKMSFLERTIMAEVADTGKEDE